MIGRSLTSRMNLPILAAALLYLGALLVTSGELGSVLQTCALAAVLVLAWIGGTRLGLLACGAVLAPPALSYSLLGSPSPVSFFSFLAFALSLLAVGLAVGMLRDRVERQLREKRAAEARYERAATSASDVIWEWDIDSGAAHFSPGFTALIDSGTHEISARISEWFDRVHPEDLPALRRELERHRQGESARFEHEHRLRKKDGTFAWVRARGVSSASDHVVSSRMTGFFTDITEQKSSESQLRRLAFHDALTGLANRALFMDRLRNTHERALRRNTGYAVLLTDLDRFKVVNDSLGHATGDLLLVKVGRMLRETVRGVDTIARVGGDEFAILLQDIERPEYADQIALDVLDALSRPVELDGHRVVLGVSIGMSRGAFDREVSPEDIMREADIAMYQAKSLGGGRVDRYDPATHANLSERLDLENELRKALEGETLHVHYQPIVDVDRNIVVGFEALARWQHPRLGPVSPAKFIPIAEEAGLIEELGERVLHRACREAEALRRAFPDAPAWRMGVNLSVTQLARVDLCARVESALAASGLPPEFLSLEITESGLLEDTETASRTFAALQARGVRLAMDDFGTGYSSLQYLRRFRIDTLKLDGSFVRDLEHPAGEEICRAVISLGRDLGLSVIAEGVERPAELERLRALGGRYAQGFLLSRPLAPEQLVHWLASMPGWQLAMTG